MTKPPRVRVTAFLGSERIARGSLADVALAAKACQDTAPAQPLLIFNDATGRVVDLDLRGSTEEISARYAPNAPSKLEDISPPEEPRGKGRPKLGVIAREITLLPRHWEWLASQPSGASVVLRRLVEEARRAEDAKGNTRQAQESSFRFMSALAGDLPGFEEATRALFAGDRARFEQFAAEWPQDIAEYAIQLAFGDQG